MIASEMSTRPSSFALGASSQGRVRLNEHELATALESASSLPS
jgi:hypothetical protein